VRSDLPSLRKTLTDIFEVPKIISTKYTVPVRKVASSQMLLLGGRILENIC